VSPAGLYVPGFSDVLGVRGLDGSDWAVVIVGAGTVQVFITDNC
jgi:hypothetical protein